MSPSISDNDIHWILSLIMVSSLTLLQAFAGPFKHPSIHKDHLLVVTSAFSIQLTSFWFIFNHLPFRFIVVSKLINLD